MSMNPKIKSLALNVLPPIVLNVLQTLSAKRNRWRGNYPDWDSAVSASGGYDTHFIFERVYNAARAVRDGKALWERDSVCFYHEEYNWQLVACLMTVAAHSEGALHVLDFGGALGSTYMQHRNIFAGLADLSWNVVEQPNVVACGKTEFSTETLNFFETVEECIYSRPVNVFLFSSVLQYLENPYKTLEKIMKISAAAIIIDRTPMAAKDEQITVQYVPDSIYPASYPCRFLDKQRLERLLTNGRTLTPWFSSLVDPNFFLGAMSTNASFRS